MRWRTAALQIDVAAAGYPQMKEPAEMYQLLKMVGLMVVVIS